MSRPTDPRARRRRLRLGVGGLGVGGPLLALLAGVVWWERLRSATALTVVAGVLLGVGIVATVVVVVQRAAKRGER